MPWSRRGLVLAVLLLAACNRTPASQPKAGQSVSGNGVTLTAASIELPTDDQAFPDGPHREAVETNCTACHSSAMVLSQPKLTREQWQAEVEKMQKVYKAPVDAAEVPGIVEYLAALKR